MSTLKTGSGERDRPPVPGALLRDGGNLADIHSHLTWLREQSAVAEMSIEEYFGLRREAHYQETREFSVFSYEGCREVLVDQQRFSSQAYLAKQGKWGEVTMIAMDDPQHRQHRDLVSSAFFAKSLDSWADRSLSRLTNDLLDSLPPEGGTADLVGAFTQPLPLQVIVGLLGAPREDWPILLPMVDALVNAPFHPEEAAKAGITARQYIAAIVEQRRKDPQEDLASTLVSAEVEGRRLSDAAIVAFLLFLLTAGGETTVRVLGTLLTALLTHPDQFVAVKRDRTLIKPAIEEAARWDPPLVQLKRLVTSDTELCGVHLPAGVHVAPILTAANRDPERWTDPNGFDIQREQKTHLAFGAGPHYCMGVHLAKREMEVAMNAFLDRVENPRFAGSPAEVKGLLLRGPRTLPVDFDAVRPAHH